MPMEATTHTLAALVSPLTRLRLCRMRPAPRKPMPCTMFEATRPLSGLPSPESTADNSVKNAAPMQIRRLVRTPAALRFSSRCKPIAAPSTQATSKRPMAPFSTLICCRRSKLNGGAKYPKSTIMCRYLARCYHCGTMDLGCLRGCRMVGIGYVNRTRRLILHGEMRHRPEPLRMGVYGAIYVVAFERDNDGGLARGLN